MLVFPKGEQGTFIDSGLVKELGYNYLSSQDKAASAQREGKDAIQLVKERDADKLEFDSAIRAFVQRDRPDFSQESLEKDVNSIGRGMLKAIAEQSGGRVGNEFLAQYHSEHPEPVRKAEAKPAPAAELKEPSRGMTSGSMAAGINLLHQEDQIAKAARNETKDPKAEDILADAKEKFHQQVEPIILADKRELKDNPAMLRATASAYGDEILDYLQQTKTFGVGHERTARQAAAKQPAGTEQGEWTKYVTGSGQARSGQGGGV